MPRGLRHGADGIGGRPVRRSHPRVGRPRLRERGQGGPPGAAGPRRGGSGLQRPAESTAGAGATGGAGRAPGRRNVEGGRAPGRTAGGGRRREEQVSETRLLLQHIDEPDLHTLGVYERLGGYRSLRKALFDMSAEDVLHELEESGLRGRGGAGFSMGKKASFIPKGTMDKYLCCNADESEPGTFKDRLLLQKHPHQLIEGCAIGSIAAGANKGFIFVRGEYEHQANVLDRAVEEAYERGHLGEGIHGSGHSFDLVVHRGQGAYICGEETALLDALEGKRGNPRLKPPFPA